MDEGEVTTEFRLENQIIAMWRARERVRDTRWGLTSVVFFYSILISVVISMFQGIGPWLVAAAASFGLVMGWPIGWCVGKRRYKRFYYEELSKLQQESADTVEGTRWEGLKEQINKELTGMQ